MVIPIVDSMKNFTNKRDKSEIVLPGKLGWRVGEKSGLSCE